MEAGKYFKDIKDYLIDVVGFKETVLPWRLEHHHITINQVEDGDIDTWEANPTVYSIETNRYQDCIYRGRIETVEQFKLILELIHYW